MEELGEQSIVIVGAGPSGLALAIELGSRGVPTLLIERNERVGYAPRAKTTNVRTRTHLRRWGIADKLAAAAPFGVDYPANVSFVTRLGGFGLTRIENTSNFEPTRNDLYPEHGQWIPQYTLEQVMREHADTLPSVRIRFNTEFVSATQDAEHVLVTVRDVRSGAEGQVRARYLIGADGARSAIRELIGAKLEGQYGLSRNYNVVFRAPGLAEAHSHAPSVMFWQVNPVAPSLIGPMDKDDVWYFMPTRLPKGFEVTTENAADLIRDATGIDLPYEIMSSDEWVASSFIADKYRDRRFFLIGDACHLHPPFGGFGMNMGVADGADLGWKLAATLQGWGGPGLLESYETERRAIHEEVIAEAAANHSVLSNDFWTDELEAPGEAGDRLRREVGERIYAAKEREFHTLGTVLGGCYTASPIIASEGSAPEKGDTRVYTPSSRPGCLAPHLWRADGGSVYDEFGQGFALVVTPDADIADVRRAKEDAVAKGEPLAVVELSALEAETRYPLPLTLVRPDQYVAWRGRRWSSQLFDLAAGWDTKQEASGARHAERVV
ncbi:FAD-dependent monooxygenase [Sphingomonas bacterium]|uniref:FAD-dependent monooxygenase n=1 Tax=Sphingomonas bacterium TaxID=1895847 RepID=UPI0015772C56|nr:FAD-dependent monooxygenase [Sphingomonas bacterium]